MITTTKDAIDQLNKTPLHKWETVTPDMLLDETRSIDGIYLFRFSQQIDKTEFVVLISAYWSKLAQRVTYDLEHRSYDFEESNNLMFKNLTERQAKAILIGLGFELEGGL